MRALETTESYAVWGVIDHSKPPPTEPDLAFRSLTFGRWKLVGQSASQDDPEHLAPKILDG